MYEPCYTCRRRRIECDRSRKPCAKCEKAGLECLKERPVRWVDGMSIRGKMRGLSVKDASTASIAAAQSRRISSKTKCSLTKPSNRQARAQATTHLSLGGASAQNTSIVQSTKLPTKNYPDSRPYSLVPVLIDPAVSDLDGSARYYLDYYKTRICKLFIVFDSDQNPFRNLISLALSDSALLKAMLALAARHDVNSHFTFQQPPSVDISKSSKPHQDALLYKYQAIQGLSLALKDPTTYIKETITASVFLLIFLDLVESGSDRWNYHLEGAKKLIASIPPSPNSHHGNNQDPGRTVQAIRTFINRQIYVIETLGASFVRPRLLSQSISSNQSHEQPEEAIQQSFLGCPGHLLHAIQYFSFLRDILAGVEHSDEVVIVDSTRYAIEMLESIQTFDCNIWASSQAHLSSLSIRDKDMLRKLSESYKIGAFIYGRRVLDALTHDVTQQDDLVSTLLKIIGELKDDGIVLKCILWPIFIAGLECQSQSLRVFVITCLERFWVDTSCLNAVNAFKILGKYWMRGGYGEISSSRWIFSVGRLGRDWLLI